MAAFNTFNATILDVFSGKHDFTSHTFKFALTNTAPVATNATLANITQITAGNGYTAGGAAVGVSASQTGGNLSVTPAGDVVITATGGTIGAFRYVVLYNDTATGDPLISWYDYGSSITLQDNETFTIDVGATLLTGSIS